MVGSNGTMIAIRLVRSKLRKRDDQQHQVNQQQQHQQCCGPQVQVHPAGSTRCNLRGVDNPAMAADGDCSDELEICWANNNQQQPMATTTVNGNDEPFQHIWQFPPPPYPGKAAQRFALYNDQVRRLPLSFCPFRTRRWWPRLSGPLVTTPRTTTASCVWQCQQAGGEGVVLFTSFARFGFSVFSVLARAAVAADNLRAKPTGWYTYNY